MLNADRNRLRIRWECYYNASALDLYDLSRNKKCGLDFNPGLQKDYNKTLSLETAELRVV